MLQFDLSFKSTTTISELEVLVEVEVGEFTTSTNPTLKLIILILHHNHGNILWIKMKGVIITLKR